MLKTVKMKNKTCEKLFRIINDKFNEGRRITYERAYIPSII